MAHAVLIPGSLYRVRVRVPSRDVEAIRRAGGDAGQRMVLREVERRIAGAFRPVLAVLEDPTDGEVFVVIARWAGTTTRAPGASIVSVEPVEEPRRVAVARALDVGLTADEIDLVRRTLAREDNPRHVEGLASTLEPHHPIAASFLRGRERLLEMRAPTRAAAFAREAAASAGPGARAVTVPPLGSELARALRLAGADWPDAEAAFRALDASTPPSWTFRSGVWRGLAGRGKPLDPEASARTLAALARRFGPIDALRDEVRRAVTLLVQGRDAEMTRFPPEVQALATASVRDLGGARVVLPADLYAALPVDGREGFISPTALHLALAESKPGWAGVARGGAVAGRFGQLEKPPAGTPQAIVMRARNQMERARRALERRRWVEWRRRLEAPR